MLRITICDDSEQHRILLKQYIEKYAKMHTIEISVKSFTSANALINYIQTQPKIDIFFMDIEMPGINGIEGANAIRELYEYAFIVFITGYKDFAIDAFKVDATDYVLKPITRSSFDKMFHRILSKLEKQIEVIPQKFVFDSNGETYAIDYDDIFYFEKYLRKFTLYTRDESHTFYMSYKELEDNLDFNCFVKCHQSYVVNIQKIKYYKNQSIILNGNQDMIPVSKSYIKSVKEAIKNLMTT